MRLTPSAWLVAVIVVTGCAAIHREQAPAMTLATTTPVGFQSVVRYTNTYSSGDPRVMRALFDYGAECAQEGRLWTTVDRAMVHGQAVTATGFDKRQTPDPQLTPACPLDPSPIPFEGRTTLTSAVIRLESSSK